MLELEAIPPEPARAVTLDDHARRIVDALAADDWPGAQLAFDEAWTLVREGGGDRLLLAAEPAEGRPAGLADRLGLVPVREILQLRRPLPLEQHATVPVRAFAPGRDDGAWLSVNNRAFAWHPEQRDWTPAHLDERMAEPWFDAGGFLVHERDGRLAAFCWTKVHGELDPPIGEIYVIGVDPDAQGLGLGRELTLAGLDHLAAQGLGTAMLYVESDNAAARRLYDDLGFTVHHTKRWWARDRSDERER